MSSAPGGLDARGPVREDSWTVASRQLPSPKEQASATGNGSSGCATEPPSATTPSDDTVGSSQSPILHSVTKDLYGVRASTLSRASSSVAAPQPRLTVPTAIAAKVRSVFEGNGYERSSFSPSAPWAARCDMSEHTPQATRCGDRPSPRRPSAVEPKGRDSV
jgi:hypothetical protein